MEEVKTDILSVKTSEGIPMDADAILQWLTKSKPPILSRMREQPSAADIASALRAKYAA